MTTKYKQEFLYSNYPISTLNLKRGMICTKEFMYDKAIDSANLFLRVMFFSFLLESDKSDI